MRRLQWRSASASLLLAQCLTQWGNHRSSAAQHGPRYSCQSMYSCQLSGPQPTAAAHVQLLYRCSTDPPLSRCPTSCCIALWPADMEQGAGYRINQVRGRQKASPTSSCVTPCSHGDRHARHIPDEPRRAPAPEAARQRRGRQHQRDAALRRHLLPGGPLRAESAQGRKRSDRKALMTELVAAGRGSADGARAEGCRHRVTASQLTLNCVMLPFHCSPSVAGRMPEVPRL